MSLDPSYVANVIRVRREKQERYVRLQYELLIERALKESKAALEFLEFGDIEEGISILKKVISDLEGEK